MNDFKIEKNKLIKHIGNEEILTLLKQAKCFIAGGALTSIFSGKEINDVDVYFRDYESLCLVLKSLFNENDEDTDLLDVSGFSLIYTNHTKKSILFTKDDLKVQFIYFRFFDSAEEIFSTFDFTINMGVYDCSSDSFVLHDNFILDIAQRRLNVNTNTSYPIISLLRIDKYKEKGYSISRKNFVNLCLSVNKLEISSWEQLSNSIGGMYGYTYTDLFDTTKEFSMDEAINQLNNLESNMDSINCVNGIDYNTLIEDINVNLKIIPKEESRIFYKKVLKSDDINIFSSCYRPSFKYKINETVNGGECGIWAYKTIAGAKTHLPFSMNRENEQIIALKASNDAKIRKDSNSNKTYVIIGNVHVIGLAPDNCV